MRGANDNRTVRMKVKMTDATTETVAQRSALCRRCSRVAKRLRCIDSLLARPDEPASREMATADRSMRIGQ
ncbi:hypothetical protein BER93_11580 [Xanthomonas fragariae]|nr:hypothetical protein BER92_11555 [Xanthomonas fragariae]AOD18655.1 hypothetical protein BER93_11580 [Xanthomonas fragariae]